MSGILSEQVAVVTGAGRGIGKAIALALGEAGAHVVCLSRTLSDIETTADALKAMGRKAWAHAVDVSDSQAAQEIAATIVKETGRVDILINNAGVTRDDLLMRMSEEAWDTVIDTNLKGAFTLCKAFTRTFMKQRQGRIINIASVVGLMGNAGQANYAASKAGLIGFTKSIAKELASRGITCNAIAPGFIETDMTAVLDEKVREAILERVPMARFGSPDDIAHTAVFLAMEPTGYMTGQVLTVDGGMVM